MSKLDEFYAARKIFYVDPERGIVRFPDSRHSNMSIASWLTEYNQSFVGTIRGYYKETENHENDYVMLYYNNYEIPTVNIGILIYLFMHFKTVKWIGLGCKIGQPGDFWEPLIRVENLYLYQG